jgi:iron complex outermembrane recepter protein
MRFFVRSLVLVLVLANMPLCLRLLAQSGNGAIAGTVQDSAGSALIGARVVVQPTGREAASDNQGNFRISDLAAGQYTITASYVGFTTYTTTVAVAPGQTANVTAALQVGSSADSVIVTAGRLQGDAEAINV